MEKRTVKISTSNQKKIEEMEAFFGKDNIEVVKGKDIEEVDGTLREVILHKSKDMGSLFAVEDTVLFVNGKEAVDIKFQDLQEFLQEGDELRWVTSVGYHDGANIHVYKGEVTGIATLTRQDERGFCFDPFFIPTELVEDFKAGKDVATLYELSVDGRKQDYSARVKALQNFVDDKSIEVTSIEEIGEWTGSYQNENKKFLYMENGDLNGIKFIGRFSSLKDATETSDILIDLPKLDYDAWRIFDKKLTDKNLAMVQKLTLGTLNIILSYVEKEGELQNLVKHKELTFEDISLYNEIALALSSDNLPKISITIVDL